ncbi:hypothetical protein VM1G_06581 [Cytospora mali]|uniref:Uncharacterized protein n=1 Tax=Cytospora mali TaxID=578113 RepID=A0A194W2I4_CYTMA|nr:hypothetical protein VM1G_06581 [Valsa mali]
MEDSPGGRMSTKEHEVFVAKMCRGARMKVVALEKKRKSLRINIEALRESLKQNEDEYWAQYHVRLDSSDKGTSTDDWVINFATQESVVAKDTKQRLDGLRGQIQDLEVKLQKADENFWGTWQDYMTKLANIPRLSPSPQQDSQISRTSFTTHATDPSFIFEDTMIPPSQPLRTSKFPGRAHPAAKVYPIILATEEDKNFNYSKDGAHQVNNSSATSRGRKVKSPDLPVEVGDHTAPSRPAYTTASPLARPPFFPFGPPPANSTTDVTGAQLPPAAPVVAPEISGPPHVESKPSAVSIQAPPRQLSESPAISRDGTEETAENTIFQGITDPKVGHIYKAYYKHENHEGWWMCTVLPTLPAHESETWARQVGISFTSTTLDLWHDAPECYSVTTQTKRKTGRSTVRHHVITGWQTGYGDGEPLETQRAFPVLFFEDRKGVKGHFDVPMPPKKFNFKAHAWDWVEAKNLRHVDEDVGAYYGEICAGKFARRLEALRQEENFSQESTPTVADDQEGRPAKRPRIKLIHRKPSPTEAQPQLTPTPYKEGQEDVDMADAGSLSGDTLAASSTGQQSDDEMSKPVRVDRSVPVGLDGVGID